MEQFQHLKQTSSVNNYIDQFEEYMIQMKRDHPYLTDNFFLLRFIAGLKDTVKHSVKSHNPSTLRTAYWQARQQEQAYLSAIRRQPTPLPVTKPQSQTAPRPPINNRQRVVLDKPRERGKCWYCPEPWVFGHKCATVKSMLNAIQLQGHSDEEDMADIPDTFHDAVPNLTQEDAHNANPEDTTEAPNPLPESIMQISAEALHGIPGDTTL
jgi:hypothetical protein